MMGLSSFGTAEYYELILKEVFNKKKNLSLNLKYFNHIDKNFSYKFEGQPNQKQTSKHRNRRSTLCRRHDRIFHLQKNPRSICTKNRGN